jgi:hypothetical protein
MQTGAKHTPEARARMSEAHVISMACPIRRAAIAECNRRRVVSDETRAKMSARVKGRVCSDETRAKHRAIHLKPAREKPPTAPRGIVWVPEMIAAFHAGIAAGHTRKRIAKRIGVAIPTMYRAWQNGVFSVPA